MSEKFKVEESDDRNPNYPVVFELEVFGEGLSPILYQSQPGPFQSEMSNEMFIELETLVKLGEIAAEAIQKRNQQ